MASRFGPAAYFPGNANLTVWDAKQQEAHSACRVLPTSAEDVSTILRITQDTSCRFAVKSGGHARDPDDSISVGGVTIDMQQMRSLEVSTDQAVVKLGSGHVLQSVYQGLEKHNLTTLGGRVADVGLGGFTLGGGFSRLSAMYGLAKDNVFEYEVRVVSHSFTSSKTHVFSNRTPPPLGQSSSCLTPQLQLSTSERIPIFTFPSEAV